MSDAVKRVSVSRSPRGERGLKSSMQRLPPRMSTSSLPSRGAWIEISAEDEAENCKESLPSRGAWIEIFVYHHDEENDEVAPLAGSVD